MGLFDSIKKVATSPVGSTVGGFMLGGPLGAGAGYLAGKAIRGAGQGGEQQQADPYQEKKQAYMDALESQRKKMTDISDKFRRDAPAIQEKGIGAIGDEERKNAKSGIQDIRKGASSRGLLYSGLRQGAEAGRIGESQSRIAGRAADLSDKIEQQKDYLDQQAVDAGLNKQSAELGMARSDYANNLKASQERSSGIKKIAGMIGNVGGMAMGGMGGGGGGGEGAYTDINKHGGQEMFSGENTGNQSLAPTKGTKTYRNYA